MLWSQPREFTRTFKTPPKRLSLHSAAKLAYTWRRKPRITACVNSATNVGTEVLLSYPWDTHRSQEIAFFHLLTSTLEEFQSTFVVIRKTSQIFLNICRPSNAFFSSASSVILEALSTNCPIVHVPWNRKLSCNGQEPSFSLPPCALISWAYRRNSTLVCSDQTHNTKSGDTRFCEQCHAKIIPRASIWKLFCKEVFKNKVFSSVSMNTDVGGYAWWKIFYYTEHSVGDKVKSFCLTASYMQVRPKATKQSISKLLVSSDKFLA